jgi:hypothetical protein
VNAALALAHRYGVAVKFADLGDWGTAQLRSEYDPRGPVIRLNVRVTRRLDARELAEFVALAIAHELYHHRERIGEIATIARRAERECAAEHFARVLVTALR